jgi:predicted aspartyl protease
MLQIATIAVLLCAGAGLSADPPGGTSGKGEQTTSVTPAAEWTPLHSRVISNTPIVEARMGESAGWFILDTGSSVTCFDEAWAKEQHLETVDAPSSAMGIVIHVRVPKARLEIGSASLLLDNTACMDLSAHSKSLAIPIAGIVGSDFFIEHAVRIRYSEAGVDLATTKRPAIAPGSVLIPSMASRYGAYITILLKQESLPPVGASAMVDTGFVGGLMVSEKSASRMGLKPTEAGDTDMLGLTGVFRLRSVPPLSLTLGSAKFEKVTTFVDDQYASRDALIGSDILSQYVLVIDYPNGLFVLSPKETVRPFGFDLSVRTEGGDITVHNVFRGSKAARDGLRPDDVLLAVNGTVLRNGEISEAISATIAASKIGGPLILRVRRGEETLEIKTEFEEEGWAPQAR